MSLAQKVVGPAPGAREAEALLGEGVELIHGLDGDAWRDGASAAGREGRQAEDASSWEVGTCRSCPFLFWGSGDQERREAARGEGSDRQRPRR